MTHLDAGVLARAEAFMEKRAAISISLDDYRQAAVLVPLIRRSDDWSILFCQRAEDLTLHSGQISFPGGGAEEGETLEQTALRETEEEIGVSSASIRLLGRLDDLVTVSGYVVSPFIGIMPSDAVYVLQTSEIVNTYEVPISVLLSPGPDVRYIRFNERDYPSLFFRAQGIEIWGLTGRILKALLDVIRVVT